MARTSRPSPPTARGIAALIWGPLPGTRASPSSSRPDAPAPNPLVHAVTLPPDAHSLAEGAIVKDCAGGPDGRDVGRNSYFAEGWLPPDPPTGHGRHDYVFQLFALGPTPDPGATPGRAEVIQAMAGRVLAAGMLVGSYSRGEERPARGARRLSAAR